MSAVPFWEKGRCPYSSLDTEIGVVGESLWVKIFQRLSVRGGVSATVGSSAGNAEEDDEGSADDEDDAGCAELEAAVSLSGVESVLDRFASCVTVPEVARRTGFGWLQERVGARKHGGMSLVSKCSGI